MQWSPIRLNLSEDQDGEMAVNLQPKNGVNSFEMEKAETLSAPPNDKQLMEQMKKTPLAPRVHRGCVSRNQPAAISGPEMEKMQSATQLGFAIHLLAFGLGVLAYKIWAETHYNLVEFC